MTPPIRVRRDWHPQHDNLDGGINPWTWSCGLHDRVEEPGTVGFAPTHTAALDAGLAHLDTHTETP